jgi:hypothetical protein
MESNGTIANLLFALKNIEKVAARRKNQRALAVCDDVRARMQSLNEGSPDAFRQMLLNTQRLYGVASDLRIAIKFEMHEILVPFLEVKQPTHAFGKQMFSDYFQWLPDDTALSAEDVVGILEEDTATLNVALEHLNGMSYTHSRHAR